MYKTTISHHDAHHLDDAWKLIMIPCVFPQKPTHRTFLTIKNIPRMEACKEKEEQNDFSHQ